MSATSSCKRIMHTGYFRCCYFPFFRRKTTLFLILATMALVILAMTSVTQIMTQAAAERAARQSPSLWGPRGPPEGQLIPSHRPSGLRGPPEGQLIPSHRPSGLRGPPEGQLIPSYKPSNSRQTKTHGISVNGDQAKDVSGTVGAGLEPEPPTAVKGGGSWKGARSSARSPPQASLRVRERERDNVDGETRHVFFLKVHKAGSTTVMNIMYRFALSRHLNVMLPKHGNLLSEKSARWTDQTMPLPQGATHFDVLCNHLVYNESAVHMGLPKDAKFIGIVREPFQQFVSAFFYYRIRFRAKYLMKITGEDPLTTYLHNPGKYEGKGKSFTHNRMSFDFGMNSTVMKNEASINQYINYLNQTFDLVMISERFDESMVLMKRLLGWQLQDVLYIKTNVFNKRQNNFTAEQKRLHKNFNLADYRLYDHFVRLFQTQVEREGKQFPEEVATFVTLRETVEQFCKGGHENSVTLPASDWNSVFEVNKTDCQLMTLDEGKSVKRMRSRQYPMTSK